MNKVKNFIKKYWLLCWLAIAFLSFSTVGIVFAAYTKTNSAKIVVARVGDSGKLFSSNYLQKGNAMPDVMVYVDAEDNELVDFVRISNFAQGNPGKPYSRAINYNLSIRLVYYENGSYVPFSDTRKIGERYIKVRIDGQDIIFGYDAADSANHYKNYIAAYTTSSSLAGASPNTDTLRVEYSPNQKALLTTPDPSLPKMYLEITATPTPPENYLDIEPLSGRLNLQLMGQVQSVVWNGYINEDGARETSGEMSQTLDDYNYVIEGVGEGTITLTWNTTYVELNKDFVAEISAISGNSSTANSLVFQVNSNNISRYDTQFYRTGAALSNYDTWAEVNGYITCTFTPASTNTP